MSKRELAQLLKDQRPPSIASRQPRATMDAGKTSTSEVDPSLSTEGGSSDSTAGVGDAKLTDTPPAPATTTPAAAETVTVTTAASQPADTQPTPAQEEFLRSIAERIVHEYLPGLTGGHGTTAGLPSSNSNASLPPLSQQLARAPPTVSSLNALFEKETSGDNPRIRFVSAAPEQLPSYVKGRFSDYYRVTTVDEVLEELEAAHTKQIAEVEACVAKQPLEVQDKLRKVLYVKKVFPLVPSAGEALGYPTEILQAFCDTYFDVMADYPFGSDCTLDKIAEFREKLTISRASQVKNTVPAPTTFQPQPQPQRHSADVERFITALGKCPLAKTTLDGISSDEGEKFVDLQAEVKWAEPPMLFNFETCTVQEKLAIEDARCRFFGKHLKRRALAVFNKAYALQFENRALFTHGVNDFIPGVLYSAVTTAVHDAIYQGNNQQQYFLDRLESLRQSGPVEHYNKVFLATLEYLPAGTLNARASWRQWVTGLKKELATVVEEKFIMQTATGLFPLEEAMTYAFHMDTKFHSVVYGGNRFAPLRQGGPTAQTPFAPNGGRGGGGFQGGRGGPPGGRGGPPVGAGNPPGGAGAPGSAGHWWRQGQPGASPPGAPSGGAGAGQGRGQINASA